MKRAIASAILAMTASFATAEEISLPNAVNFNPQLLPEKIEITFPKKGFFYLSFGASDSIPNTPVEPGYGVGYRRRVVNGSIDVSGHFSGTWKDDIRTYAWIFPKMSYLHYLNPNADRSAYGGFGLAWGALEKKNKREFMRQEFVGIIGGATFGMEFMRKSTVLTFAECNITQPALANSRKGSFPGPIVELSVGAGF